MTLNSRVLDNANFTSYSQRLLPVLPLFRDHAQARSMLSYCADPPYASLVSAYIHALQMASSPILDDAAYEASLAVVRNFFASDNVKTKQAAEGRHFQANLLYLQTIALTLITIETSGPLWIPDAALDRNSLLTSAGIVSSHLHLRHITAEQFGSFQHATLVVELARRAWFVIIAIEDWNVISHGDFAVARENGPDLNTGDDVAIIGSQLVHFTSKLLLLYA